MVVRIDAVKEKGKHRFGTGIRSVFVLVVGLLCLQNFMMFFNNNTKLRASSEEEIATFFMPAVDEVRTNKATVVVLGTITHQEEGNTVENSNSTIQDAPRDHPRAGAFDEFGRPGYRHDPTVLRNKDPSTPRLSTTLQQHEEDHVQICAPPGKGKEGEEGYKFLNERLQIAAQDNQNIPAAGTSSTVRARIICVLYTYEGHSNLTKAISETWGERCDGILFATTLTDKRAAKVHIPHLGKEGTYGSIWQKVRSMLFYIHDHFRNEYDFVHVCGDDTYLVVENLRSFVASTKVLNDTHTHSLPFFVGGWIRPSWKRKLPTTFYYNGGGPGYTLNMVALNLFIRNIDHPECNPDLITSEEDLYMGICFEKLGVLPYDSRDEHGYQTYHHLDPRTVVDLQSAVRGERRFWYRQKEWFQKSKNITIQDGLLAASNSSISFHRIKTAAYMRRIHKIIYETNDPLCAQ
jgi:hypothetical protein